MPVSRGSVRHSLLEDGINLISSVFCPRRLFTRASSILRVEVNSAVTSRFSVAHSVLFPFARSGLYATLKALNLPPGSQILLTPITIGPMLEIIHALGYRPVFLDIELETFGPDLEQLRLKLADRPACFLLTYLFGYVPDIEQIERMCRDSNTILIEDFSHNIGAESGGRALGTFGAVGIYSASLLKYVDGYNGAFVVTNDPTIATHLERTADRLQPPSRQRLASIIRRTFIWNFALSRIPFNVLTYPALWLLKLLRPALFEKLLGPSIDLQLDSTLPDFYFEDIATFQCKTILRHLSELEATLESRRTSAQNALAAFDDAKSDTSSSEKKLTSPDENGKPTFWQFVIPVNDLTLSRDQLFHSGVETGATNLMDLASASGVFLPNTQKLKKNHLFIPLHRHLQKSDYLRIFKILRQADQL